MDPLILRIPYPVSKNNIHTTYRGKIALTPEAREFYKRVTACLKGQVKTITDPVRVCAIAYRPDKRRRDVHNLTEAIMDAMTHAGVWDDDSLVEDFHIKWGRDEPRVRPGAPVTVIIDTDLDDF